MNRVAEPGRDEREWRPGWGSREALALRDLDLDHAAVVNGQPERANEDQSSASCSRADALAARTYELVSFLTDVMGVTTVDAACLATATYHDSCAGLRELGIKAQPRALLESVAGLTLAEMADPEVCCGFGGTFCVKYPDISTRMVADKTRDIAKTGSSLLLAGDMGCLLNMAGRLQREGSTVQVRHVAEVLAGITGDLPPIGEARR